MKADYACLACCERWTLPVSYAGQCPECHGEVARIWDAEGTANVNRGAPAVTMVDTVGLNAHEKQKLVDAYVQPQWEQANKLKGYRKEGRTQSIAPAAALGSIGADGRSWSRYLNAPLVNNFPFPAPHVDAGHGGPIIVRAPTSKPSHVERQ